MGRVVATVLVVVVVILGIAWSFGLINLNQTREAELPSVAVQGGQMPKFDADVADVDVGTKNETIKLPKVEVGTTKEKVPVPTVDVDKPAD